MGRTGQSSGRTPDSGGGTLNSGAKKVDSSVTRGSKRDSPSGKITSIPSSTRRSQQLEKWIPPESPLVPRKSKRLEQQSTPSPLRRSGRRKTQGLSPHSGSKSSEKASSSVKRHKKKGKKEKSVEQLTMESVEVSLDENQDHEAFSLKRKRMTARNYKALFIKQRKLFPVRDSDDKLERRNLLPTGDNVDNSASGSQQAELRENGSLQCELTEIESPLEGVPEAFASSLKDGNDKISRIDVEAELAYSDKSLSDKPPGSSAEADLGRSLIGCTNRETVVDVNMHTNDHTSNGKLQSLKLDGSTSMQKGDISLESGEQVIQSEIESCALHLQVGLSRILVNKDSSTQVVEAASTTASTNCNGNGAVCSNGNVVNLKEISVACGSKPDSSKFVEYWVPVPVSNVQLEQYCATLLANTTTLCSSSKKDNVGALHDILMTIRKCCNHPYIVDELLQPSFMKELEARQPFITTELLAHDILNVGVKASGKLELLDMILSKIREQKLRVLVLFQKIAGAGGISIGDILDDFLRQRFGPNSYERIDNCLTPAKKQDAMNKFNTEGEQFVLLLEHRACSSSLKLFSVDIAIIFDTEFNPANDIKDLQRMSFSQSECLKVFRLYSSYTLEEKVLILVKHHKNVQNILQSTNRTRGDSLLMWGALVLFNRLDKFHAEQSTMFSADISSGQQWLLNDIVKNFMAIILNNSENTRQHDSILSKAFVSEGVYQTDCLLLGEKEVQSTDGEERQLFWKKLLEGRCPRWRFWGPTTRIRKRVTYDDNNETATKHQKVIDTRDNASTFQSELERGGQDAVTKSVSNQSESLPVTVSGTLDKGNKDADCLSQEDSFSDKSDLAQSQLITSSDEQMRLHMFLRAEMEKLCVALELSTEIKRMVETFLEYVMKSHHVNKEPASILQAFQISLCWIAASILKEKNFDKRSSLTLAKKVLNFQCTEEEAYFVYLKLRSLKKTFLQLPRNDSVSLPSQNVVSATQGTRKQPPYAGHPLSVSFDLQNVKTEADKESSSLESMGEQTVDELNGSYVDRKIKKLQQKCDKHMFQLQQQHKKQILEFHKMNDQEKLKLEGDYRLESALIRTTYPENATRMDMLKLLDTELKKKMQEHENSVEAQLRELQATHSAEMERNKKMVDDRMAVIMSCIPSLCPEKEVRSANPDTGKQNPDGIVHDYGAVNVITSGISVTIADNAVGGVVCSETSLSTPVNPVPNEVLQIELVGEGPVTVAEQPEETSQRPHQISVTIAPEAVVSVVSPETSLCTPVNPVPDEVLEIERTGAQPVTVVEQPEETSQRPPQIPKNLEREAVDNVVCSETSLFAPVNPFPAEVLEIEGGGAEPVTVVEQTEERSQRSHQIPETIAQEAVDCSLNTEDSLPLLNSTSETMLDTAIEISPDASAEQVKEVNCFPHRSQDITEVSFHGMDERAPIDLATSKEQNSYKISSSGLNNEPSGVPGMAGSEIGNASTSEMDTSLEMKAGDGARNPMRSDATGNQDVPPPRPSTADITSLPIIPSELPQKHVCENTEQLASECNQLAAEAVHHGHIEGRSFSPTPAASVQIVEGSVELPNQAVSQNGDCVGLPSSVEGMDADHRCSQIEGNNALPTSTASLQIVEGSVEHSHQGTVVLPPSSEVAGLNRCDNHFDMEEIVSGTDDEPNNEFPAVTQNILAPIQQADNIIRPPNQALVQSEPNLTIAEGPTHLPVHQMPRISYRNRTLAVEPLQIERKRKTARSGQDMGFLGPAQEKLYRAFIKNNKRPLACKYFKDDSHFSELYLDCLKEFIQFHGLDTLMSLREDSYENEMRQFYANLTEVKGRVGIIFKTLVNGVEFDVAGEDINYVLEVPFPRGPDIYPTEDVPSRNSVGIDVMEVSKKHFQYTNKAWIAKEHKTSKLEPIAKLVYEVIANKLLPGGKPSEPSVPKIAIFLLLIEKQKFSPGFAILKNMATVKSGSRIMPYGDIITLLCKCFKVPLKDNPFRPKAFSIADIKSFKGIQLNPQLGVWESKVEQKKRKVREASPEETDSQKGQEEGAGPSKSKKKGLKRQMKKIRSILNCFMEEKHELKKKVSELVEKVHTHQGVVALCFDDILSEKGMTTYSDHEAALNQ